VLVVRRVWRAFFAKAPVGEDLRHALLDGTVADDIDNVTNLVLTKVGGQSDHALLLEVAGEGCIEQSAWVFAISHIHRIAQSARFRPMFHPPSSKVLPSSSFLPATRCVTNHSEFPF
jgi:hypothetical protein